MDLGITYFNVTNYHFDDKLQKKMFRMLSSCYHTAHVIKNCTFSKIVHVCVCARARVRACVRAWCE
jgi:hypothetical protein